MTGDQADFLTRLKSLLPGGWFGTSPVLDGVLSGVAKLFSDCFAFIQFARTQTRIKTATGGFLDLVSQDYFLTLRRRQNESDDSLRQRIIAQLFLEKGTRYGLTRALELLTGRTPVIFEPARPADTGAYNTNTLGYGVAGGYGSLLLPYQGFVTAFRPLGQGIPNVAGYGSSPAGYSTPSQAQYASLDMIQGQVRDSDIYDTVSQTLPVATVAWTRIA